MTLEEAKSLKPGDVIAVGSAPHSQHDIRTILECEVRTGSLHWNQPGQSLLSEYRYRHSMHVSNLHIVSISKSTGIINDYSIF